MFNDVELERMGQTFRLTEAALFPVLEAELKGFGYQTSKGKDFLYGIPEDALPLMMVAHVDTVHNSEGGMLAKDLTIDKEKHSELWNNSGGLGADDRAGVLGIRELLYRGHRPHVLFTDGEERGMPGAKEAGRVLRKYLRGLDVRLLIELDRMGADDCVFYDHECVDTVKYVESFGFKKAQGSSSDVRVLGPDFDLGYTNLSIGYYNAHSSWGGSETLKLNEWLAVLARVEKMFASPPEKKFPFVSRPVFVGNYVYADDKRKPNNGKHGRDYSHDAHRRGGGNWTLGFVKTAGVPRRKAIAHAWQAIWGPDPEIDEFIDAMTADDEAQLEADLWASWRYCFDDYCLKCEKFTQPGHGKKNDCCFSCDTPKVTRELIEVH